jgi:hypothetical protein
MVEDTRHECRILEMNVLGERRKSCEDNINMGVGGRTLLSGWGINLGLSGSSVL